MFQIISPISNKNFFITFWPNSNFLKKKCVIILFTVVKVIMYPSPLFSRAIGSFRWKWAESYRIFTQMDGKKLLKTKMEFYRNGQNMTEMGCFENFKKIKNKNFSKQPISVEFHFGLK